MRLVEPDYSELLKQAHRRWMETRDPKDGDRFADLVLRLAKENRR
jgi:hypothetical protein